MSDLVLHLRSLQACDGAIGWAGGYTDPVVAWAECPRGDWMLWLLAKTRADHRTIVLAACDCARLALVYVPEGEERPRRAIEVTEAWARNEATIEEVRTARSAVDAAAAYDYAASFASASAFASAFAAAAAADDAAAAAAAARRDMLVRCADAVRARFPTHPDLRERAGGGE